MNFAIHNDQLPKEKVINEHMHVTSSSSRHSKSFFFLNPE